MKFFVYYHDDYYENGGVGLEEFDNQYDAEKFILARIEDVPEKRSLKNYTVIYGDKAEINAVQYAGSFERSPCARVVITHGGPA